MTKRVMDLALGGLLLILSAPLQVVIALLVACDVGRPVLFRQLRPGRHGHPFREQREADQAQPVQRPLD